ncbi:MAG: YifB family Mg chelatase-like AAA ATPase [Candidatus Paceibacterota bacterium]|jgi:magnesium chelatase family protein
MSKTVSKIFSAELEGINSRPIEVETDINVGLASFTIVGLADKAVSEAKERVSSAIKNSGLKPPNKENRKITVNLAPADVKKNGSQYDLAIALGYLLSSGQMRPFDSSKKIFIGELSLDGKLRRVVGVLNIVGMAKDMGFEEIFIPKDNSYEASFIKGIKIYPVENLVQIISHLEEKSFIELSKESEFVPLRFLGVDISEIKGQENAKRALMIAAAGGHNIFMSGPPGAGKTMLAQSLVSVLPQMSLEEALETTKIYSAAGLLEKDLFIASRPFRSPHHNASMVSVVGGGQNPRPGEVSLAHRGVLFLDEIPEFHRDVLEALRQPLEDGKVTISRSRGVLTLPCRFMMVAASNPCPCGYFGDDKKECQCNPYEIARYQKKLSGPLLDRIDIHIWVGRLNSEDLKNPINPNESESIRKKIFDARNIQKERFNKLNLKIFANSELSSKQVDSIVKLEPQAKILLDKMFDKAYLSARGYFKILKVAQTIADLDGLEIITPQIISEAFSYRARVS